MGWRSIWSRPPDRVEPNKGLDPSASSSPPTRPRLQEDQHIRRRTPQELKKKRSLLSPTHSSPQLPTHPTYYIPHSRSNYTFPVIYPQTSGLGVWYATCHQQS